MADATEEQVKQVIRWCLPNANGLHEREVLVERIYKALSVAGTFHIVAEGSVPPWFEQVGEMCNAHWNFKNYCARCDNGYTDDPDWQPVYVLDPEYGAK